MGFGIQKKLKDKLKHLPKEKLTIRIPGRNSPEARFSKEQLEKMKVKQLRIAQA